MDDVQLLLAYARDGDVAALSELVVRNGGWQKALLRGLVPSDADVEDVFQETWFRVIRSCGSYRGGSVRAYLATVARSAVVDRFRRNGQPSVSLDAEENEVLAGTLAAPGGTPGEHFETRATREEVRQAVRALPGGARDVLMMRIEGGMTFQEIADSAHLPLGTVLTWMRRATLALRKRLGVRK